MTRPPLPGAEGAIIGRLIARVDQVESAGIRHRTDLAALTRAVTALSDAVRLGDGPDGPALPETPLRDWLAVSDPAAALSWLIDASEWQVRVGAILVGPVAPCWPWHPAAVVSTFNAMETYEAAYSSGAAGLVADVLTRWLPAHAGRLRRALAECTRHEHSDGAQTYSSDPAALPDLAQWWATDRTGTAPGLSVRETS